VVTLSYGLFLNGNRQTKKKEKIMAKNMTRKGLALGAAFALTATGLVATPAYAADL
jgi:hypothetical protein